MRRVVWITGAAKGIGGAIAEKLAEDGFAVVLHYHRSEASALALAEKCANRAQRCCLFVPM